MEKDYMVEEIWNESCGKFIPRSNWIVAFIGISEFWKSKITSETIKEIILFGEKKGFITEVIFEKQYWIILKPNK
jgi:hypothetical protein